MISLVPSYLNHGDVIEQLSTIRRRRIFFPQPVSRYDFLAVEQLPFYHGYCIGFYVVKCLEGFVDTVFWCTFNIKWDITCVDSYF